MSRRLSIIMPSFNDARIAEAIESVRRFDDIDTVKLVIIDGGSRPEVVDLLKAAVRPGDILVSEPDKGIFDGLNKGLDRVDTEYLGWLGSDDLFTGHVKASEVVKALEGNDLFVTTVAVFRNGRVRRATSPRGASLGLVKLGLHNPHYGTFGRSELMRRFRFRLDLMGSDIDYFLQLFGTRPNVLGTDRIGTLQAEGGYSTRSLAKIYRINSELVEVYRQQNGAVGAVVALAIKIGYKSLSTLRYRMVPRTTEEILQGI